MQCGEHSTWCNFAARWLHDMSSYETNAACIIILFSFYVCDAGLMDISRIMYHERFSGAFQECSGSTKTQFAIF